MKSRRGILTWLLVLCSLMLTAQNPAIDFDGSGDISNSTVGTELDGAAGLTMMGWVNLNDPVGGFPNFDGVMGYRNELDFDFYILQLNSSTFEGRFRNNFGIGYSLNSPTAVVNAWQHVALTYDGSVLSFYHNGVLSASVPASGTINSAGETFYGGLTFFGSTAFRLDGQLDNIQLWDRALSGAEILDYHCREILDTAALPSLKLHWTMNENMGTMTADAAGANDGTFSGGVTWTTSGATICELISNSSSVAVCPGDSAEIFGTWQSATGDYTDSFTTSLGYDSLVTVSLENFTAPSAPTISMPDDTTLMSSPATTYQWFLDAELLAGETNQNLYNPVPGTYSVDITDANGCAASSDTFGVQAPPPPPPSGLEELQSGFQIWIRSAQLRVELDMSARLELYDLQGRLLIARDLLAGSHRITLDESWRGLLLAQVRTDKGRGIHKVVWE